MTPASPISSKNQGWVLSCTLHMAPLGCFDAAAYRMGWLLLLAVRQATYLPAHVNLSLCLQVSHSHLSIASLTNEPLDHMCSVETAPLIRAVVVGKGADFSNYPDDEEDGQPVMPQASTQSQTSYGAQSCLDHTAHPGSPQCCSCCVSAHMLGLVEKGRGCCAQTAPRSRLLRG
jgi:hypothetical protein